MHMRSLAALALIGVLSACAAPGEGPINRAPVTEPQARIPFVHMGSIEEWQPVGDQALYIRNTQNKWYLADFYGPCFGLDTSEDIGFVPDSVGTFDRWGAVVVDGRRCVVRSLTEAMPPERIVGRRNLE